MNPKLNAKELAERLAEERAVITVQRDDLRERRKLDALHRDALAEVQELTTSRRRARRERDRDEEEAAALAELYRRAARSGARARIRTDIDRSAEMRALRVARVRSATLLAGVPVLVAFGAWSTAGVQAGVVKLLGLDSGTAGWWAAWAVEPALITIVALIIIGRAVLRASGGDTDWRATVAEWTALTASVALNMAGGWVGGGWTALGGALAHSVGPLGAAGTAFLIGLFVSYVSAAQPWAGAPRLADLDLTPPPAPRPDADADRDDLDALVEVVAPTPVEVIERVVEQRLADLPAPVPEPVVRRPRWRPPTARRPRRMGRPTPAINVTVVTPDRPKRPATEPANDGRPQAARKAAKQAATTEQKVASLVAKNPAMTQADVAARLQLGTRTVRRYWPKPVAAVNGHDHSKEG